MGLEEKILKKVEPMVTESVLGAGLFQTKGSFGKQFGRMGFGAVGSLASEGASALKNREASGNRGASGTQEALPPVVVLAISPTNVYAFKASNAMGLKVKELVATWPRKELLVSVEDKSMTYQVTLEPSADQRHELEILRRGINKYSEGVVRLLTEPQH